MLYHVIKIGEREYKCALNMKSLVSAEKRLGENPLNMLMRISGDELPSFESLMILFHESLQKFEHGITMDDTYNIYDEYTAEGNTFADFMLAIVEIFKTSGLIKEEKKTSKKGKVNSAKN